MNSRERVIKTLNFDKPDRVPRDIWALPYVQLSQKKEYNAIVTNFPMDFYISNFFTPQAFPGQVPGEPVEQYTDDWGSIWYVGEPGLVGEVKIPVLSDLSKLRTFKPPFDIIKKRDFSQINKIHDQSTKFILSDVTARPFERLQFLRGTQNLFYDLGYNTKELHRLLEMVHEFQMMDITNWCKTEVDAIFFMDDLGTNKTLLINPQTWREIFKPLYIEYVKIIHKAGKYAFFHSDGNTEEIFEDFIEIGIDAINSQLFTMNIEELGKKYKGRITFWGEMDRQHILPFCSPEEIFNAVTRVRKALDNGKGGLIAQCEWGKNNPFQNIKALFEAWDKPFIPY